MRDRGEQAEGPVHLPVPGAELGRRSSYSVTQRWGSGTMGRKEPKDAPDFYTGLRADPMPPTLKSLSPESSEDRIRAGGEFGG